jgi:hypothetical protein
MLFQTFNFDDPILTIVSLLLATIFLWLMLWVATRFIIGKDFASNKKIMLLLAALLIVVLVPIVTGGIMYVLNLFGGLLEQLRNFIDSKGQNTVGQMAPIIAYLIFLLILKFMIGMDWKEATWISLIGIFLLYLFYSFIPELNYFTV